MSDTQMVGGSREGEHERTEPAAPLARNALAVRGCGEHDWAFFGCLVATVLAFGCASATGEADETRPGTPGAAGSPEVAPGSAPKVGEGATPLEPAIALGPATEGVGASGASMAPTFDVVGLLPRHQALADQVGETSEARTGIDFIAPDGSVVIGSSWVATYEPNQRVELTESLRFTRETGSVSLGRWPGVAEDAVGTWTSNQVASRDASVLIGLAEDASERLNVFRWTGIGGLLPFEVPAFAIDLPSFFSSQDGATVGIGANGLGGFRSFRWTASGVTDLGFLPGYYSSALVGVNPDGSIFYGNAYRDGAGVQGFRWSEQTGMVGIGFLDGFESCSLTSVPVGSSSYGNAVFGTCDDDSRSQPFVYTEADGIVSLGSLDGYSSFSPSAISVDGNVVIGTASGPDGARQGFRWARAEGMRGLEADIVQPIGRWRDAMSRDGAVVLLTTGDRPFRWTEAGGGLELQALPGDAGAEALGVSEDGTLVAGSSWLGDAEGEAVRRLAVVWSQDRQARSVASELQAAGIELKGFVPTSARPLPDGSGVYGVGTHPDGSELGWVATHFFR